MNTEKQDPSIPSLDEIIQYLTGFYQEGGEKWREENKLYLSAHANRFYKTLRFLPDFHSNANILELGAEPYFMSILLKHYTDYSLYVSNDVKVNCPTKSSIKLMNENSCETIIF